MGYTKNCGYCGVEFISKSPSGMYCSARCRSNRWKENNLPQRKEARTRTANCRKCDTEFRTSDRRKVYCTTKCRWTHINHLRTTTRLDTRTCPSCGTDFKPLQAGGVGKTYCTARCKRWANYQTRKVSFGVDGITKDQRKRYGGNWIKALQRDDFTCQLCNIKIPSEEWRRKKGHRLVVHHKDLTGAKKVKNHDIDNLETFCVNCHELYHSISLVFVDGKYNVEGAIFKKLGITEIKVAEEAKT